MSEAAGSYDKLYFTGLSLENVRAFGGKQHLDLTDGDGRPSMWNLILGENGVGKTTVMQALARMSPVPAFRQGEGQEPDEEAGAPTESKPSLSLYENVDIQAFARTGDGETFADIEAGLVAGTGQPVVIGVALASEGGKLTSVRFRQAEHGLAFEGPLIIGYGAARHVGHRNAAVVEERDPTEPLFSEAIDLYDAEEILSLMDYAALSKGKHSKGKHKGAAMGASRRDAAKLRALKAAIADLIPETRPSDIDVRGPRVPGRPDAETGVHFRTPSGIVPLSGLSHGYQTVIAWTVDLAWRLFKAYPRSADPMREDGVVLIDEIDLHLHPRWQRSLRHHLTRHFPGVQFIATTHSPVTAQETLSVGGNVAVVRWEGDHAVILNKPLPAREWRFDQVLTSDLFGFASSRGPEAEALMTERLDLLRKPRLTRKQRGRLVELDGVAATLPTARSPAEQQFEDLMRKVALHERVPVPR